MARRTMRTALVKLTRSGSIQAAVAASQIRALMAQAVRRYPQISCSTRGGLPARKILPGPRRVVLTCAFAGSCCKL